MVAAYRLAVGPAGVAGSGTPLAVTESGSGRRDCPVLLIYPGRTLEAQVRGPVRFDGRAVG
jgi:hypothetical protein